MDVTSDYRWVSVSSSTGRIIADLPGLVCPQVGMVLGGESTTQASLPLFDRCPTRWEEAVQEKNACLVLLDAASDDRPVWGGPVIRTIRSEADEVPISLASWEWFLRGFYVGDRVFTGVQQTQIVATLLAEFVQDSTHPLIVEAAASAILRDDSFVDEDDKRVLDALTAIMNLEHGPEWTVGWRRLSDPERYVPVMSVADRIGVSPMAGLAPAATFEMPGPVASFELTRSYATGDGATDVMATSNPDPSNPDAPRPQSPHQVHGDGGPTVQYRFTPTTSITQIPTLTSHAAARVALMAGGSRALALTAIAAAAPRLGSTWGIGDDLGYAIQAPSVPASLTGTARALGWTLDFPDGDPATVTPILGVPA